MLLKEISKMTLYFSIMERANIKSFPKRKNSIKVHTLSKISNKLNFSTQKKIQKFQILLFQKINKFKFENSHYLHLK